MAKASTKLTGTLFLASATACSSEAAIAQTKPVRVCTAEVNIYLYEDHRPGSDVPRVQMSPASLPPDFSTNEVAPDTIVVAVPVEWTEKGFEGRLLEEHCDFVTLTWWERRGRDALSIQPPPMLNDDIDPAWSMSMEAAPDSGPIPSTTLEWIRHFELDGPGLEPVLTTRGYPYSGPPEKKLTDIAKQMGMEVLRILDTRPRIEDLPTTAAPSKLLPLAKGPAPSELQANDPAGTTGNPHRAKLTIPRDAEGPSHVVINGHNCTPGDPSDLCKNVCGGAFGPCVGVQRKLRLQEERFVLARRLLVEKGVPFEPFTLLQPGGLERLRPVLDRLPEMRQIRREASPNGVIFADTLYLPENARFGAGPTVVIVHHIVFEGRCDPSAGTPYGNVWGTNGLYLFQLGESKTLGMTLEQAMQEAGITEYGEKNPPPFSVVKDLDIPKCQEVKIGNGARKQK